MLDPNEENTSPAFPSVRVVITTNLQAKPLRANTAFWVAELIGLISRHTSGDWVDLDEEDQRRRSWRGNFPGESRWRSQMKRWISCYVAAGSKPSAVLGWSAIIAPAGAFGWASEAC